MVDFWEVVRRAELTGPKVEGRDFDMKHVALKVVELQQEHGIKYDPEILVPNEGGLADDVWQAAIELLLHSGVYYAQTGRVIRFTEEEIMEEIRNSPKKLTLGEGEDEITVMSRDVDDTSPPKV
ncbi:MAG TPA: monomethylamine:corrinoid methyltransferase, partial [Candidatus Bathyarchaeia archaeon]|nr:monomethylamine:corrinoid methyltransferase [Candidatus Bathyarchaeia archaeon]